MLQRFCLILAISLHTLTWGGVEPETSLTNLSKARFSLSDFFKPFQQPLIKVSSSDVLRALGKFLPIHYQKGIASNAVSGCPYHIGDYAQGGVIIFLTHDGLHGLVAAIEDASSPLGVDWGPDFALTNATNNDPLPFSTPSSPYGQYYGGYKNQQIIENSYNLNAYPAFQVAANYSKTINGVTYNDWWLPSSRELSLMYALVGIINQVSVANGGSAMIVNDPSRQLPASFYWSSLDENVTSSWFNNFFDPHSETTNKTVLMNVRCVRAF